MVASIFSIYCSRINFTRQLLTVKLYCQQKLIENSKDQVQIKQNISASDRLQTNVKSKEDANSELTIIKQITGK